MKTLHRSSLIVFAVIIVFFQGLVPALAQPGPRESRGTQLYRGPDSGSDPGRPLLSACVGEQPCRIVGMVDPGGIAAGPLILDGGYFAACTPGACGVPAPFVATPAFLAGTSVAAAAGLGPAGLATVGIIGIGAVAVGVPVGVAVSANNGPAVQTGSQ